MGKVTRIAIIGDLDEDRPSHLATVKGLQGSATALSIDIDIEWIATKSLEQSQNCKRLLNYDGIWGAPGDPESSLGFTNGIQVARENQIPYLGT